MKMFSVFEITLYPSSKPFFLNAAKESKLSKPIKNPSFKDFFFIQVIVAALRCLFCVRKPGS